MKTRSNIARLHRKTLPQQRLRSLPATFMARRKQISALTRHARVSAHNGQKQERRLALLRESNRVHARPAGATRPSLCQHLDFGFFAWEETEPSGGNNCRTDLAADPSLPDETDFPQTPPSLRCPTQAQAKREARRQRPSNRWRRKLSHVLRRYSSRTSREHTLIASSGPPGCEQLPTPPKLDSPTTGASP